MLFVIPNMIALLKAHGTDVSNWGPRPMIMMGLVALWGLRLSWHIGSRHTGVEDFRYQAMRKRWSDKGGKLWVTWMAFSYVFMMQAAISCIVNAATLKTIISVDKGPLRALDFVGIGLFAIGFLMEAISDYQLQRFKNNPKRVPG